MIITSLYAPNGNPQPGPKFTYKLAWLDRLYAHAAGLLAAGVPVVLAGDFNIVPTDRDIYATRRYHKDGRECRARYARLLAQGWCDAVRSLHPDAPMYSYWSLYRWPRDAGLRIDHLLLSKEVAPRLRGAGVDRDVRVLENASDHVPVWIELGDAPRAPRKMLRVGRSPPQPRSLARFGSKMGADDLIRNHSHIGFSPSGSRTAIYARVGIHCRMPTFLQLRRRDRGPAALV